MVAYLFADDTVLFAENKEKFQVVVDKVYSICTRRKLKTKDMVFERRQV